MLTNLELASRLECMVTQPLPANPFRMNAYGNTGGCPCLRVHSQRDLQPLHFQWIAHSLKQKPCVVMYLRTLWRERGGTPSVADRPAVDEPADPGACAAAGVRDFHSRWKTHLLHALDVAGESGIVNDGRNAV